MILDVYKTWTPGPWPTSVDPVHGPLRGPGPWTTHEFYQRSKQILVTFNDQSNEPHILHFQFHTNGMGPF